MPNPPIEYILSSALFSLVIPVDFEKRTRSSI